MVREAVEPARDDVQPRRDVAAARQREPQVERAHLAHERAVLVPGAADGRLGLAQRRLLHGDQRRLAEVAGDQRRDAGGLEQLQHVEAQHGRVDRQHAAALLDPGPLVDRAEARMRAELLVPARGGPGVRPARSRSSNDRSIACANASAASRGTSPRTSRQPSRRIPARSSSGVRSARAMLRQPVGLGQAVERGRRVLGSGRRAVEQADAGEVAERQEPALGGRVAVIAVGLGEAPDLGEQLVGGAVELRGRRRLGDRRAGARSVPGASEAEHAPHGTQGVRRRDAPGRPRPSRPPGRRRPRPRSPRRPRPRRSGRRRSPWRRCRCSRCARSWRPGRRPRAGRS